jgi:hypothetical protein
MDDLKDCINWVIGLIKKNQAILVQDIEDAKAFSFHECKGFFDTLVVKRQAKIDTLIEVKVGLEKYRKKLKNERLTHNGDSCS